MKIRPAGSFQTIDEAMKHVAEVKDRAELLAFLRENYGFWNPTDENVTIKKHGSGVDERIGWNTYLILVGGKAALFSDGSFDVQEKP